jgi:hypothetical protein
LLCLLMLTTRDRQTVSAPAALHGLIFAHGIASNSSRSSWLLCTLIQDLPSLEMTKIIATDPIVFAAADDLCARGIEPTVMLLQEQTKGSYTTVGKALTRWRAERASVKAVTPPPVEITAKADQFARALWNLANDHAQQGVAEVRRSAELVAQTAAAELAHAQAEIGRLEGECARLEQQLADARHTGERERVQADAQSLRAQRLELERSSLAAAAEETRQHAQAHLLRMAALDGECASLKIQVSELLQLVGNHFTGLRVEEQRGHTTLCMMPKHLR